MPQLLFYLKAEEQDKELEMEWGTVLVYSCSAACSPPQLLPGGSAYLEEWVAIQRPPA